MISVIIPTYYRYHKLNCIFSCLRKQSLVPDEIIIVDQTPSLDRPDFFYEKFTDISIKVIFLDTPSLSASRNLGAQKASGDYLLFLDDDMEFCSELIRNHLTVMEQECVDVVYGAISTDTKLPEFCQRETKNIDPLSWFLKSPNMKWDGMVLVVSGANTMIKRESFLKVGGFDERMPRMEDIELGYRLFRNGAKMYYSSAAHAVHNAADTGGTRKTQKNMQYIKLLSKMYLYRKHFNGWMLQQFYFFVIKNGIFYRDLLSGVFYMSHLLKPFWPLQTLFMLYRAHRQTSALLKE